MKSTFRAFFILLVVILLVGFGCMGGMLISQSLGMGLGGLFGGPPQNQATLILQQVQALSELTTTRYNYSVVVNTEREMPELLDPLYGESLTLLAVGHVEAGIDLRQLSAQNILEGGDMLTIVLPPPVIQSCFLNEQASYVAQYNAGIFAPRSADMSDAARHFAIQELYGRALNDGIIAEAQQQAQSVVQRLAVTLGNPRVNVVVSQPDPNAPPPDSCQ